MTLVWVTRSEPGAGELSGLLDAAGLAVVCHPVVEIERFARWRTVGAARGDETPAAIIVLSMHAADAYAASILAGETRTVPHFSVGPGTARRLAEAGIESRVPETTASEGLLALPEIVALPAGAVVWLMAGEGGRDVLELTLGERGVETVKFEWYRRRPVQTQPPRLADVTLIEVASATALEAVAQICADASRAVALVVPSERLAALALE